MGRKKVFPTGNAGNSLVNPLQRMLGTYLRVERTKLGYSSEYVAGRLSLTDTYLRLVETGRASLNQSLVFKIIEVFADSNTQTHDSRTISFSRLAIFMVGAHWLGAEMALLSKTPEPESAKRAIEALGLRDNDFQVFFERTSGYLDQPEGSPEQRKFLETVAAPEVGEFLRSDAYGHIDIKRLEDDILPLREFLELPTLNIDILLDLKQALAGRSFVHTADVASIWESKRSSQFRYVRGLYSTSELVISKDNLDSFHFEYLSEKRFSEVQMIFITAKKNADSLKDSFIEWLNHGRKKVRGLEPLTPEECKKIHFACLSVAQEKKHAAILETIRRRDFSDPNNKTIYDAYWSFETLAGLHIGFVGLVDKQNPDSTRNLDLRMSFEKARQFDELWRDINATHKI